MIVKNIEFHLIQRSLQAILLVWFGLGQLTLHGQTTLKGRLRDTVFKKDCSMAVVAVLGSDSTLVRYARSGKDGFFILAGIRPGKYYLFISHPSFSCFWTLVRIGRERSTDLGVLVLPPKADTLMPFVVTPRGLSPSLRHDTLEYNTAHVKMRVNATVEELLHHVPGIQIDPDGSISINGQKIDRLLVDGKDFFNGDPAMITRNFNGEMIAKVQVLDKKGKQAEFTGIDDGQRVKTINLVLKEDSKRGTLMKAEIAGDPHGYFNTGGLLGSFNGSMQLAALAMATNTGVSNFSGDVGSQGSGLFFGGGGRGCIGSVGRCRYSSGSWSGHSLRQ